MHCECANIYEGSKLDIEEDDAHQKEQLRLLQQQQLEQLKPRGQSQQQEVESTTETSQTQSTKPKSKAKPKSNTLLFPTLEELDSERPSIDGNMFWTNDQTGSKM